MRDFAHRPEAVDGVAAHEAVDLDELLVGEAEIRLADRHQLLAVGSAAPDPERVIGVIGGAFAAAALRVHQHRIDECRSALPFPP